VRSFTIATDRIGPRRWCRVHIHDTVEQLRTAGYRTSPWHGRDWWDGCMGCFQPSPVRIDAVTGVARESSYAGILRLANGWVTAEIVAHELVHAALHVFRMNVHPNVHLGPGCRRREEQLAYIYGELYASFEARFHE
jgi:hypothetical protein